MKTTILFGLLVTSLGCRSEGVIQDTSSWWQEEVEEDEDEKSDDKDTEEEDKDTGEEGTDTGSDGSYDDCESDFDPDEPCEGTWVETICMYDDLIWWCQEGVWMNEDDKEE